jgi:hypothetical protein
LAGKGASSNKNKVAGNYFHAVRNSRVSIKTGAVPRAQKKDDSSRDYAGFSGIPRREMISAPLNPNSSRITIYILLRHYWRYEI